MFALVRFGIVVLALAVWGCKRESVSTTATSPATAKSDPLTLPAPPVAAAVTPEEVRRWIADLPEKDGAKRLAATQALFRLGDGALEPLRQAGARQLSPFGSIGTRRLDMVYSLLEGLVPNPQGARAGYTTDGFGLHVEPDCTSEEVKKLGEKYGFTVSGSFRPDGRPQCYVKIKRGQNLEEVLEAILCDEPRVVTVNLNYFDR